MKRAIRKIGKVAKQKLYFAVAAYFGFFARIYLKRWRPTIITVTGSSGKTTLLHLFEAQLGDRAWYSHRANSTFGIPFHILGLERKTYGVYEWLTFALRAPFRAFRSVRPERIYVTEADAERPGEGKFIARLLRPDILVWLSLEEAHGAQYDALAHSRGLVGPQGVKKVIAEEFGWFLQYAKRITVLFKDNEYIEREAPRSKAEVFWITSRDVVVEEVGCESISFLARGEKLSSPRLMPPKAGLSIFAVASVLRHLGMPLDPHFKKLALPPGRSSVLRGRRGTTLIDSTYNATFDGMRAMLELFALYPATGEKWLVLGDMVEQGESEAEEHASLASLILAVRPSRAVLVGPRLAKYTKPLLTDVLGSKNVAAYDLPGGACAYLARELRGGETILFKGARYLEGIVERLLLDPSDASKLCRREPIWTEKRRTWGI